MADMTAAEPKSVGNLTQNELAELRVRQEVLAAVEEEADRLNVTRGIILNERKLFLRSVYTRLDLSDGAEYTINIETGAIYPAPPEDQS